jgi:hypothetical protein
MTADKVTRPAAVRTTDPPPFHGTGVGGAQLRDAGERPGGAECPDVQLVQNQPLERRATPACVRPRERQGVDHFGRAVDALRLEARGRVRKGALGVKPEAVEVAGAESRHEPSEEAGGVLLERVCCLSCRPFHTHLDVAPLWGPHSEADPSRHTGGAEG